MHLSALPTLLASILGAGPLYPAILPHPHGARQMKAHGVPNFSLREGIHP
jgi:hypothetical protein